MRDWQKKPGECHDRRGVPIYPGDLLKTFHFTGPRKKKYWLYHIATVKDGGMMMVSITNFGPTNYILDGGGNCWLNDDHAARCEVISGHGPEPHIDYEDRPRKAK